MRQGTTAKRRKALLQVMRAGFARLRDSRSSQGRAKLPRTKQPQILPRRANQERPRLVAYAALTAACSQVHENCSKAADDANRSAMVLPGRLYQTFHKVLCSLQPYCTSTLWCLGASSQPRRAHVWLRGPGAFRTNPSGCAPLQSQAVPSQNLGS